MSTGTTNGRHYSIFCSYLQIYNEKVFDLLNTGSINALGKKPTNTEQVTKQ